MTCFSCGHPIALFERVVRLLEMVPVSLDEGSVIYQYPPLPVPLTFHGDCGRREER